MEEKKRVLLLTQQIDLCGGIANFFSILENKFHSQVEYFFTGSRSVKEKKPALFRRLLQDYQKYLRKLKSFDLVHVNTSLKIKSVLRDSVFMFIAKLCGKKTLVFIHGWDQQFEKKLLRFLWLFRLVFFKADAIIVLSGEFQKKLSDWGYIKSIYQVSTVVDDLLLADFDKENILCKNENSDTKMHVLFLSRIEKDKGIYELIDAFYSLKPKYPYLKLFVAGNGGEYIRSKEYVTSLGLEDVCFCGYVKDEKKRQLFIQADIFCLPTFHGEGMPTSVVEAMAFGLPVVTRAVGGLNDFFVNNKMGFITAEKDSHNLTLLLEKLIVNDKLRKDMGLYNYQYAKSHFLSSHIIITLESIYSDLMSSSC